VQVIRSAGADQEELLGGDAPQQRVGWLTLTIPPDGRGDLVRVHRQRQRGRAARPRELANQRRELAMAGAAAAELARNPRRKGAPLAKLAKVVRDEYMLGVVGRRS